MCTLTGNGWYAATDDTNMTFPPLKDKTKPIKTNRNNQRTVLFSVLKMKVRLNSYKKLVRFRTHPLFSM